MSDIVEELRRKVFRGPTMEASHTKTVEWKAADEIERLRAENEAGLRNTLAMQNAANVLRIRAEKAEAEIERLRAALEYCVEAIAEWERKPEGIDGFLLGAMDNARAELEGKDA